MNVCFVCQRVITQGVRASFKTPKDLLLDYAGDNEVKAKEVDQRFKKNGKSLEAALVESVQVMSCDNKKCHNCRRAITELDIKRMLRDPLLLQIFKTPASERLHSPASQNAHDDNPFDMGG